MTTSTRATRPLGSPHFGRLTRDQCETIHNASLTILERTGVRLFEPAAVDLLKTAGATVVDGNRVTIPARLVERALASAPRCVQLYTRNGDPAMTVEGYNTFFGPGSDCLYIVDHRTWEHRRATLQDVREAATVCDALEHIDFVMSMFLPEDVDETVADRFQMEIMLHHTVKPILFVAYGLAGCRDAVEMAEIVAGGAEALRRKPFVAGYANVNTPLRHDAEALQRLMFLAQKGLPAIYVPVAMGGSTGPVTPAGSITLTNAGGLAGLVIAQLVREGTPVLAPTGGTGALDMLTMISPYSFRPDGQGVQETLKHYYDLPMFAMGGVTDSKLVDQQAGVQAALMLAVEALAGGNIIHDLGYLESGLAGSLAQLAICEETAAYVRRLMQPVEVSHETLALDVIHEVGPDGSFIESDHTMRHFRERWYPKLFDRDDRECWLAKGGKTMAERAADRVDAILAEHTCEPLPAAAAARLSAVVQRAAGG